VTVPALRSLLVRPLRRTLAPLRQIARAVRTSVGPRRAAAAPDAAELVSALPGRQHLLLTGATGFIGRRLVEALAGAGHDVTVLARDPASAATLHPPFRLVTGLDQIPPTAAIDAVVNLAGEPVADGPWTRARRRRILGSRLRVTRGVVHLIGRLERPPAVLVSASAIGWYGNWHDEVLTEFDGGKRCFSHRVCEAWESAARRAELVGTRVVRLRIGLVLGRDGGMLRKLVAPFALGLGGPLGSGQQWMSWIERDDLVRLIAATIADARFRGPVNATAPVPVRNAAFAQELGRVLRRPARLRIPALPLRWLLRDLADELLLQGQRVVPDKAEAHGFAFRHATLASALAAILGERPGREAVRTAAPETQGAETAAAPSRARHGPIIPHRA